MLVECATSLLEAFGTTVRYDPAGESRHPPEDGLLAIIGFACGEGPAGGEGSAGDEGPGGTQRGLRGSLVLSANRGLLERSRPVPPGALPGKGPEKANATSATPSGIDALQDWIGELANQLLGRLKSRLLAHGIAIQLGTPTTVSGLELRVRTCTANRQATPLWLLSGDDWLVVRLDAIASPDVQLSSIPDPSSSATEGEVLLF
jgi:hypothetical protein